MRNAAIRAACAVVPLTLCASARAEPLTIENPGGHAKYTVELEPHALLGFGYLEDGTAGVGLRGTVILMDPGFVPSINNAGGITFGADVFLGRRRNNALYIPVQAHWSFFFSKHWSAFGEGGVGLRFFDDRTRLAPAVSVGGRYNFNDRIAITLRLGYPAVSFGVSFFL
jgi:hypothetical protein